jgi:polynucleotide 5'-hydroxyl-kinase GRC3/NOL9
MMDILPRLPVDFNVPAEWLELDQGVTGGTFMLVGATDSGKSTMARWLIEKACSRGRTAAWLDADLGQSSLGIPGTLNVVNITGEAPAAVDRAAFFVGSTSPRGHMLQILTGVCRLCELARSWGADPVFIDTSGLVAEEFGGGALKEWEVELLRPSAIIALQRGRELEHLLAPWRHDPRLRLHLVPVAAGARKRSQEERAGRRRSLFGRFFDGAGTLRIYKGQKPVYGLKTAESGCLAGLIDREGFLLAPAVVRRILPDRLEVVSRWSSPDQVAVVRVGKLRIDPLTGTELHRVGNYFGPEDEE